jgi:hypothetical protein
MVRWGRRAANRECRRNPRRDYRFAAQLPKDLLHGQATHLERRSPWLDTWGNHSQKGWDDRR